METIKTMTFVDRTDWPSGQWDGEPDKVQWFDPASGFDCLAVRNRHSGNWCGYVGVPEGHRDYAKEYMESSNVDVHGGLTFSGFCHENEDGTGLCHVPQDGRPEKVWWLGFDCAHSGDCSPTDKDCYREEWASYRTLNYVQRECENLARQFAGPEAEEDNA